MIVPMLLRDAWTLMKYWPATGNGHRQLGVRLRPAVSADLAAACTRWADRRCRGRYRTGPGARATGARRPAPRSRSTTCARVFVVVLVVRGHPSGSLHLHRTRQLVRRREESRSSGCPPPLGWDRSRPSLRPPHAVPASARASQAAAPECLMPASVVSSRVASAICSVAEGRAVTSDTQEVPLSEPFGRRGALARGAGWRGKRSRACSA